MKVQELINAYLEEIKKNDCEYPYSVWTAGEILEYLDNTIKQVASDLDFDEHRWYIISTNVYKCEDGFIGVRGVSSLRSEMMDYSDCDESVDIFECIEKQTVTYIKK